MAKKSQPATDDVSDIIVTQEPAAVPVPVNNVPRYGRLVPQQEATLSQCPTSLDLTSPRGKALAIAAGNPSDIEFGADGKCRVLATDWIVFPDQGADPESGLISQFCRVVFYDKSGGTYRTTSAHAPHRLAALCDLYSREEWKAGIPLVISERRSRKTGRTYHDIRVDIDALPVMDAQE